MIPFLFLFLLLAGPVGAETFKPGPDGKCHRYSTVSEPTNGICDIFISNDMAGKQKFTPGDDCLAQMEQAMRAMEPYMVEMEGTNIWFVYKNINLDGFKPAKKFWNDAKRDCWRTP